MHCINLVMQQQHVRLILKYLKERDCMESFLTLERESGVSLHSYSKEVDFFRRIVLKGDFNEAVTFVLTFENRIDEKDLRRIVLDLYRQKLYELIEDPDEDQLRRIFEKEIVGYCSEEEFQELFNTLTYRSVSEIEGLERWTPVRGRYECFEAVVPYLEMFNSVLKDDRETLPTDRLETVIDAYYSPKDGRQEAVFAKNKTTLPVSRPVEQEDRRLPHSKQENEREAIKNSIINMNLSGNYSQIRTKPNNTANPSKLQEEDKEKEKQKQKEKQRQRQKEKEKQKQKQKGEKSSVFDRNASSFSASNVSDRRPRVNASLNGPMNQKIDSSVKIDNYLRNDPISDDNIPPPPARPSKALDKSQNFSQFSQPAARPKRESPPQPVFKQQNPVLLNQLNDLSSSELNEISEEERSDVGKFAKLDRSERAEKKGERAGAAVKPSYIFSSKEEEQELEEEIKRNIEYLEQSSSVIYKSKEELEREAFTFSHDGRNPREQEVVKKLTKLAAISDSKAIRTCQFSPSAGYFAVGTNSSVLKVFDVQRLFEKNRFQQLTPLYQIDNLHQKSIFCLDWARSERALLTCSNDLYLKLTEIGKGFADHRTTVVGKHDSCVRMVRFSGAERMVSCGDDSVIRVWDCGKLKRCTVLKGHSNSVSAFKLQSENEIYSVSKDMTIRRWDLRVADSTATSRPQDSELTYIANNTDRIVASHRDGTVSFFRPDLEVEHSVRVHEEEIRSVQALRGEETLLTASFDGHVGLFTERNAHSPNYFQHNDAEGDKVVFATFLHSTQFRGFASTSTLGLCHLYSYE